MSKEKRLVPDLRFPEFDEEWKQSKLKDIGVAIIGLTYKPEDVVEDGLLVLRSSNIKGNKILLEDNVYVSSMVNPDLFIREKDILICSRNGSKALIGKCAFISNTSNLKATFGAFMTVFRSDYNSILFYMFQTKEFFRQIYESTGATINQITTGELYKYIFYFPGFKEQQKIATFLSLIDKKIELLEKKVDLLEEQKRGLLQKIFSQEIRFKKDDGSDFEEWKSKCLGEISKVYQPETIKITELKGGNYKVFGANGYVGYHSKYNHELPQVTISCRGEYCGTVNYVDELSWITGNSMVINIDAQPSYIQVNKKFLYYALCRMNFRPIITGSGQPQITRNNLVNLEILVPDENEQKKIADFFASYDLLIKSSELKCKKLVEVKKGLLQLMFI